MAEVAEVGDGTNVIKTETKTEDVKTESGTKDYSEVEQRAMEQGWDPDYDGPNKRDAQTFIDRGELLDKIKSQSGELKAIKDTLKNLTDHNKNVFTAGYETALKDLRAKKAQAVTDGDGALVVQLDDAIDKTREHLATLRNTPTVAVQQGESAEFVSFKKDNPLYTSDEDFRDWAHGVAIAYAKKNPSATESDVYEHISTKAKSKYPTQGRRGPPNPDGATRGGNNSGDSKDGGNKAFESLMSELSEQDARVARDFVKRGVMTKEKYVADYNSIPR